MKASCYVCKKSVQLPYPKGRAGAGWHVVLVIQKQTGREVKVADLCPRHAGLSKTVAMELMGGVQLRLGETVPEPMA